MKRMKKLTCLLLAVMLVFCLTATASAETGSITINNAVPGQVYTVYRMFDLESYDAASGAYSYKINSSSPWYGFAVGAGAAYISVDARGYVSWIGEQTDEVYMTFAQDALAYAKTNSVLADASVGPVSENQKTVVLQDMPLGYYLIDSSLGTLCILNTTNPDAVVQEKNVEPSVLKMVREDSTATYGESNDAGIGETVAFQTTITAGAGAQKYTLHDKMSGLTFTEVTGVTLNGSPVSTDAYTVLTQNLSHGCSFEVAFSDSFCDSLVVGDEIVVSYTAVVNANAVIRSEGNLNETWLSYGEMPETNTEVDTTTTYVWDFNVLKYTSYLCPDDNCMKEEVLAGAEFVLYREYSETAGDRVVTGREYAVVGVNGRFSHWTRVETEASKLVSDVNGMIHIAGLDSGTYWLKETLPPDGYNMLTEPIKVIIKNDGSLTDADGNVQADNTIKVENKTGAILPSTGGMGTTLFYVLGGALVLAAVVLLIARKRMSVED